MSIVLVTGSAGLIGSEAVRHFCDQGHTVVGLDNDMRRVFFGADASTDWNRQRLETECGSHYIHHATDIRDEAAVNEVFQTYASDIALVIHAAAQPSHDWAASDPMTDFSVNALGTLILLEACRRHCPATVFVFCSTNKVYGDTPNQLPLVEEPLRWEIAPSHPFKNGIDETMTLDRSMHSLFGVSKTAADLLVQEYGRYFGMQTTVFRGGCLTGPAHAGTQLHGFLSYLMKCTMTGTPYTVFGYDGKQVRDNIHSHDLVRAFDEVYRAPRSGEAYNIGGGRPSNCSMLEAIAACEEIADRKLTWSYVAQERAGDHQWWISDTSKFESHYPGWRLTHGIHDILLEIFTANSARWV